ncbi:MAG: 30S ribosomal protein S3 [Nanoarchaeota archaeon]|nr:30S ribosomal protein S3 [Nanoarchaeota archaeon]
MAQKIKPTLFRLGITKPWKSKWFFKKSQKFFVEEDYVIRKMIEEKISQAGIAEIRIERTGKEAKVFIRASRPGLIIGRGGKGIEDLKNALVMEIKRLRRKNNIKELFLLMVNVEEIKRTEISAPVVAQQIASDIERRLPFRRVIKRHLETLKQVRGVEGGKIRVGGRLNGSEISRREWLAFGRMPLQTLRADIDYGEATSYNTYGTIGVKVWIYKGEIFEND